MNSKLKESHHEGRCHCGAVRFRVKLVDGFSTIRRCNCSMCARRGAVAVSALLKDLDILQGEDALSVYQFNTKVAKHFFCSICGIYPFHQRRSNPEHYGINVACLDDISPFDFEDVPVWDGAGNHPRDISSDGSKMVLLGTLRFESD